MNSTPIKYSTSLYRQIDIGSIDYILVTHIDKGQGIALPTLIRSFGFRGVILMTLPLRQIGVEMLKEFYKMNQMRVEKGVLGEGWKSQNFNGGMD
jgi:Cft2 family RNA processing exonuclease